MNIFLRKAWFVDILFFLWFGLSAIAAENHYFAIFMAFASGVVFMDIIIQIAMRRDKRYSTRV